VIGLLLHNEYQGVDPDDEIADKKEASKSSFISAGIYAVLCIACLARYLFLKRQNTSAVAYEQQRDERLLS